MEINDFSGGATLNEKVGKVNQFFASDNVDFLDRHGYIAPGPGWVNLTLSASEMIPSSAYGTDFIKFTTKDNNLYAFCGDGKIYYQDAAGTLAESFDTSAVAVFRGAAEYNSRIYYSRVSAVGYKNLTAAANAGYTNGWKTSGVNTADWHIIHVAPDNKAYMGNGQEIANWSDDGTDWDPAALDLAENWEVIDLSDFGYRYLAIAANYKAAGNEETRCKIFLWDRTSSTWQDEISVPETQIQAIKYVGGYLWIWAGKTANIYVCPETSRKPVLMHRFEKVKITASDLVVFPGAVVERRGTIYFGLSDGEDDDKFRNPSGIYSFPYDPANFSLSYVEAADSGERGTFYNRRYRALGMRNTSTTTKGMVLFASMRDTSGTAFNRIMRENLYTSDGAAYDEGNYYSFVYEAPKNKKIRIEGFGIKTLPLPAGSKISLRYASDTEKLADGTSTFPNDLDNLIIDSWSTTDATEKFVYMNNAANASPTDVDEVQIQLEVIPPTATDSRPFVKSVYMVGDLIDKIE